MSRYFVASFFTGLLFGTMDGLINGNAYAVKLMEIYEPISKNAINVPVALLIDMIYGFMICGIFIWIRPVLPTNNGIIKGLVYGLGIWFFRIVMGAISSWMMYTVPDKTLIYVLWTGLLEMMVLGLVSGLILKTNRA